MSKHDGLIRPASEAGIDVDELLAALGGALVQGGNRRDAMAQYLSGQDGWRDARKALRGTFAGPSGNKTGLTDGEDK